MAFTIPNEADAAFADQAEVDSVDLAILTAADAGTGVVSGCAVTAQGTPDMTVAVASGTALIAGTEVAVTGGNVTITAADGTNPRFDLVVVNSSGTKSAQAGTPSSNPVFPAIPADSVVLASVYVPASDTDIDANQIIDKRVLVTSGGGGDVATDAIWDASGDLAQGTGADTAARLARGTSLRDRLVVNGTSLQWQPHLVVKTSDQTVNNSTALVDDSELSFAVAANESWVFWLSVRYSSGATPDIDIQITAPSGATLGYDGLGFNTGGTLAYTNTLDGSSRQAFGGAGVGIQRTVLIFGNVQNGATPGDVKLRWAQDAAEASNTVVHTNSSIRLWRTA